MPNPIVDLSGKQFGTLLVLFRIGHNKYGRSLWMCECKCGRRCEKSSDILNDKRNKACSLSCPFSTSLRGKKGRMNKGVNNV